MQAQATSAPVTDRTNSQDNGERLGAKSSGKARLAVQKGQGKNQQKGAAVAGKHKSEPGTVKQVEISANAPPGSTGKLLTLKVCKPDIKTLNASDRSEHNVADPSCTDAQEVWMAILIVSGLCLRRELQDRGASELLAAELLAAQNGMSMG
ncbi:MAG: hypothetical protein FRX49_11787 [Trebouxia sp. A1-2]|nr:MAG: hypothetical protein FRX49_11787 [Trebouxia sp. A1-2]